MNSKDRLLTICIPTYNRKDFLENQLSFFQKQIEQNKQILDSVSFIVSNNSSTDGTLLMLNTWDKHLKYFEHYTNELNVGLVGNIKASLDRATTKYVWFVSDDDELREGVLEKVLDSLNNFQPEYLFINYAPANNLMDYGYIGKPGYFKDSMNMSLKIFNEQYGSLVFMTSSIYKRDNILELNNDIMSSWISVPLLYSFYSCSKGPMYIIGEPLVIFNPGNASYAGIKRVLKIKFEEYIKILERLVEFGYNKNEVCKTIKTFFKKQSHSHFLYNFVNIRKSIKYYKYYNFSTFLFFPVNTIKYLFTRR